MSRPGYVDKRGSNADRARRRAWLLATFDPDLGPDQARCALAHSPECLLVVDVETLSVDRIEAGGSYRRGNIQPACKPCQDRQGGLFAAAGGNRAAIDEYAAARDARDALRESDTIVDVVGGSGAAVACYQLSDEEFAELFPPITFRQWLEERAGAREQQASSW